MQSLKSSLLVSFSAAALTLSGCQHFAKNYDAATLSRDAWDEPQAALAHYLMQANADDAVCDLAQNRPHLPSVSEDSFKGAIQALAQTKNSPEVAARCLGHLFDTAEVSVAQSGTLLALNEAVRLLKVRVADDRLNARRVSALAEVIAQRPHWVRLTQRPAADMSNTLSRVIASLENNDARLQIAVAIQVAVDAEQGQFRKQSAVLALESQALSDQHLSVLSWRLPDTDMRHQAREKLVRRRVAKSVFASVRNNAEENVRRVLALGVNAIEPKANAAHSAYLVRPIEGAVQFRQDNVNQVLFVQGQQRQINLKGLLKVSVEGFEAPVSVCDEPKALKVEPCIDVATVTVESSLLQLSRDGVLRLPEQLTFGAVLPWTLNASIPVSLRWYDRPLTQFAVPFHIEAAEPVEVQGDSDNPSPRIAAKVTPMGQYTFVELVTPAGQRAAWVDLEAPGPFVVRSIGAGGRAGHNGRNGHAGDQGRDGADASCPNTLGTHGSDGTNGVDGARGQDGASGSAGGSIEVTLNCEGGPCQALIPKLGPLFGSAGGVGGKGGEGGRGGDGGRGGRGGRSTWCTTGRPRENLAGGLNGVDGRPGATGATGYRGLDGTAGEVRFRQIDVVTPMVSSMR